MMRLYSYGKGIEGGWLWGQHAFDQYGAAIIWRRMYRQRTVERGRKYR